MGPRVKKIVANILIAWFALCILGAAVQTERVPSKPGSTAEAWGEITGFFLSFVSLALSKGVYHHASRKHIARYVNEFTWRLNDGKLSCHNLRRSDSFVDVVKGCRITYNTLIGKSAA
jgi:ISXO2 transposase-like protein